MSNKEQQIYDLMRAIRRNTKQSPGIDVFENLMNDLQNTPLFSKVLADMNLFIEHFTLLWNEVYKIYDIKMKAKILTYDFINPKQYFRRSFNQMKTVLSELKTLNVIYNENRNFNMGNRNILGVLPSIENVGFMKETKAPEDKNAAYELIRKEILLWNYIPAIVKAFIMTKRRNLGLDKNSTKF